MTSAPGNQSVYTPNMFNWRSGNPAVAQVQPAQVEGVSTGVTFVQGESDPVYVGYGMNCVLKNVFPQASVVVITLSCPSSVTRGGTATCTVTPSSVTVSNWQFKDSSGNTVSRNQNKGNLTWSGTMVTSGTVSVNVSGITSPLTSNITVNNRTNFAFTAVAPMQLTRTNTITCYSGAMTTLQSPPVNTSFVGASCADIAFSDTSAPPISDNGPNSGYQYVTSVSSTSGSQPTQYQYIVVSDVLSPTAFYKAQCGTYPSSNSSGFIAGSQLSPNIFDHEQGSVFSHWTEYRDAQNNSNNNVGTVLEAVIAAPGTSQADYSTTLTNDGKAAINKILTAVSPEPCSGSPNQDSSQSCASCGSINYSPYQSCGNSQPVPYCH